MHWLVNHHSADAGIIAVGGTKIPAVSRGEGLLSL